MFGLEEPGARAVVHFVQQEQASWQHRPPDGSSCSAVVRAPRGGEKATSKPLCTLRRGDCFGELCLASAAEGIKRTRRRTSVVAKGSEPLVLLTLSPDGCKGRRALEAWQRRMSQAISAEHVRGVDCVTVERLVESGKDVASLFPKETGVKPSRTSILSSYEHDSDSFTTGSGWAVDAPGSGGIAAAAAAGQTSNYCRSKHQQQIGLESGATES